MRWRVFILLYAALILLNLVFIILRYFDFVEAGFPYAMALMLSIYSNIKLPWVILIILALFMRYGGSWGKVAWIPPALLYLVVIKYVVPYSDLDIVKALTTYIGTHTSIACLTTLYTACVISSYTLMHRVFKDS